VFASLHRSFGVVALLTVPDTSRRTVSPGAVVDPGERDPGVHARADPEPGVLADDCTEFSPPGRCSLPGVCQCDWLPVVTEVRDDRAGSEVRARANDAVTNVREMRNPGVGEQDAVFTSTP